MNKILIALLVCVWSINIAVAQTQLSTESTKAKKCFSAAEKAVKDKNLSEAIFQLERAVSIDPNFREAHLYLGDLYSNGNECEKSIQAYNKAYNLKADAKLLFYIANEELRCTKYEDAKQHLTEYLAKNDKNPSRQRLAKLNLRTAEFAAEAVKHPVKFNPQNLGANVNTEYDEYLPTITADEEMLIFTVLRPRDELTVSNAEKEEDFFVSYKDDKGEWQPRKSLGKPINTHYNEGAQCISPDGKYLFFTSCNRENGYGSCDLYWAKRIGNRWSNPRNMGEPVNTKHWESQPTISSDGKTIYFTSNRPGGVGQTDIWMTEMVEEGVFTEPVNVGPPVNTEGKEMSPFIHPDGQTLYFSSDGHVGMGGMDLFYSRMQPNSEWGEPINLGYPINTGDDEVNLIVNAQGDKAFFSSNKDGGFGGMDLYWFELDKQLRPTPVTFFKGKVFDDANKQPLEAAFELIDIATGKTVVYSTSDSQTGEFLLCLPINKHYALNVNKEHYLFYSESFELNDIASKTEPVKKDIPLKHIKVDETVVLNNVFFDTDKFILKPESYIELNKLVDLLQQNTGIRIEISGHTDNVGGKEHNEKLSSNRAKAVADYLISKGIASNRLTSIGYGYSKPIATNETEVGRAQNRRTEFRIIAY